MNLVWAGGSRWKIAVRSTVPTGTCSRGRTSTSPPTCAKASRSRCERTDRAGIGPAVWQICQSRLDSAGQCAIEGGAVAIQSGRDGSGGLTFLQPRAGPGHLFGRELGFGSETYPLAHGEPASGRGASIDQGAFEFGNAGGDGDEDFAAAGRGVSPRLVQGSQSGSYRAQPFDDGEQIAGGERQMF